MYEIDGIGCEKLYMFIYVYTCLCMFIHYCIIVLLVEYLIFELK